MFEASAISVLMMLFVVWVCYDIGVTLVYALPKANWLQMPYQSRLIGFAISPFVATFCALAALAINPLIAGAKALVLFSAVLIALAILLRWVLRRARWTQSIATPSSAHHNIHSNFWYGTAITWFLRLLLGGWVLLMFFDAVFLPLTQNDALEYLTVANLIADHQSLWVYPAIHPETEHSTGFFGPWTHPPAYPALLAIFALMQGGASETPGILRAVSPWFLLAAACGVYALGSARSRLCGLAAAAMLVSMPLLTLGSGSSLIDSLVVAATTLAILAIVGIDINSRYRVVLIGMTVGLGAWMHSQALLLIPIGAGTVFLMLLMQRARVSDLLLQPTILLAVAVLFASLPYVRNLAVFGSLVSDNPVVFALPELKWEEYVRASRGYVTLTDIVQYGLFKGWFLLEAYGIVFWIALLAFAPFIKTFLKNRHDSAAHLDFQAYLGGICVSVFFIYLAGVLLSILLGLDIMIKNERYLLIIAPTVSILAATVIANLKPESSITVSTTALGTLGAVALVGILLYTALYRLPQLLVARGAPYSLTSENKLLLKQLLQAYDNEIKPKRLLNSTQGMDSLGVNSKSDDLDAELSQSIHFDPSKNLIQRGLMNWSNTWLSNSLPNFTPADALVLAIRPADMYYARERKMISFLDPRMVPFYKSKTDTEALQELNRLGITHVQVPDYSTPVFFNTRLQNLLAAPEYSRLVLDHDGNQLYELSASQMRRGYVTDLIDARRPWTVDHTWEIAARKSLLALGSKSEIQFSNPTAADLQLPIFKRNMSTSLSSGLGSNPQKTATEFNAAVSSSTEYLLTLRVRGKAYLEASIHQYSTKGKPLKSAFAQGGRSVKLMEFPVGNEGAGEITVSKRFRTLDRTASLRLSLTFRGVGHLEVLDAKLVELTK